MFFLVRKNKKLTEKNELIISLLFLISLAIFIYNQLLTKNQIFIFFLIPIAAAYSHVYVIKYFNKKYLIYFILIIFIFSTTKYHIRFNHHKKFMELANVNFNLAEDASKLDKRLSGLKWITPHYPENPKYEINLLIDIKNFLLAINEEKIIITDYQFFSSLLNNKIASPNKWYDDLSIPDRKNKYYYVHKNFFLSKIKKNKIKHLFFIGKQKHKMNFFEEFINEKRNSASTKSVTSLLGNIGKNPDKSEGKTRIWNDIDSEHVKGFISGFYPHKDYDIQKGTVNQYIDKQNQVGGLDEWTICLFSRKEGRRIDFEKDDVVYAVQRTPETPIYNDRIVFKQIIDPKHEAYDLTEEERGRVQITEKKAMKPASIRNTRPSTRGLLLIYPLHNTDGEQDKRYGKDGAPVFGVSISSPLIIS